MVLKVPGQALLKEGSVTNGSWETSKRGVEEMEEERREGEGGLKGL